MNKQLKVLLPYEFETLQPLLLFDGNCGFCNSCIRFVVKYNRSYNLNLAPFQSVTGQKILELPGLKLISNDSLILIQDNVIYLYSTAVLLTAKHLDFPWKLAAHLMIVPENIRDVIYLFVSKKRNFWFGGKSVCSVHTKELSERLLP